MKQLKKLILFLVLFLFVICLKTTVFGVTLTEIEYNGVTYKPDVEPLTLQTTTNSYIVGINKSLKKICVVEPYNPSDYLVAKSNNAVYSGTYNTIDSYDINNNTLSNIYYYSTEYKDGAWSEWACKSMGSVAEVAPGSTTMIVLKKSNVALYVNGLGIVGTDVISSGVPLPDGISLTDNIVICKSVTDFFLFKTDNINNYFVDIDNTITCNTESGALSYFNHYRYANSSFNFIKNRNSISLSGDVIYYYSFNDINIDNTMFDYASKKYFNMEYVEGEYIFPYIADTDEVLSNLDDIEKILIFPGNITTEYLPITFNLLDITNNKDICSITLDTNSPYYLYIVENPDDFWFEIPTSEFKDCLVNGNQYSFNIIACNNLNEFTISRNITYSGTSGTPPTEEDKQTDAIINQTEKIEEQTNAIVNQTEKIEEQTEVQKSIFERIGDILSYINPLSENFFAYKLVDLLIDALKSLFVPEERVFR